MSRLLLLLCARGRSAAVMQHGTAGIKNIARTVRPLCWSRVELHGSSFGTASRCSHGATLGWRSLKRLQGNGSVESFRRGTSQMQQPILLPLGHFSNLPAITKWFKPSEQLDGAFQLDYSYLERFSSVTVPLELISASNPQKEEGQWDFQRSGRCFRVTTSS